MDLRKTRACALHVRRIAGNFVRARILSREHIVPYVAVYQANLHCNANCGFCSRAIDIAGAGRREEIPLHLIETIFRQLRKLVGALYVAGGEPLLQKNIVEILALARKLDFFPVAVNTNATLLRQRAGVLREADVSVVSLHSVRVSDVAQIFSVRETLAARMLDNIEWASEETRRHGNRLVANCVLTADNVATAHEVLDFCLTRGITFAVVPAVIGYMPAIANASERELRQYRTFMSRVIAEKHRCRDAVQGSFSYLDRLRTLEGYDCRPTGIITIDPLGHVVNPCDYKYNGQPTKLGMITRDRSARQILQQLGEDAFSTCDKHCPKACLAEPALSIEDPVGAIREILPFTGH